MRRIPSLFLAAASLALTAGPFAAAATRPRYGGTLVVETGARLASLDPAKLPAGAAPRGLAENLLFLVGNRLVRLGRAGQALPSLAVRWQVARGNRSWTFDIRPDVQFQDGKPLVAADVVAALAALHPSWRLAAIGVRRVRILLPRPERDLPLRLALAENSIVRAGPNGLPIGTGPFRLAALTSSRATLVANDDAWLGRPFLDGVTILMGRAPREQWIDLQLGRADLVELTPDEVHRAVENQVHVWTSEPDELVALVFEPSRPASGNAAVRRALARAVNRAALRDVLLQKQGEVTSSILPAWLSGYAFLFDAPATAAPRATPAAGSLPALTLAYDSSDPVLASFAGRIAVDARAAGLDVHLAPQTAAAAPPAADVRLVRERVESLDPRAALESMVAAMDLKKQFTMPVGNGPSALYAAEKSLLSPDWVIPLVDLSEIYGLGARVEDWMPPRVTLAGGWRLADVWKEPK